METSQVKANLERELDKELQKYELELKIAQQKQLKLGEKDRDLHGRGKTAAPAEVKRLDDRIGDLRGKIEEQERQLVSAERQYSKVKGQREGVGKWLVGLSGEEVATLAKLSSSYKAFEPYMATGLDPGAAAKGEACAWNACWTCSEACGGCTGCGQACSQINACIAKQE